MSDYERIKTKLDLLREKDKDLTISGARWHKYQSGPPLTESQIHDFETKHEIRLPEDFRGFLMEVGNGGTNSVAGAVGPYYGIYNLLDERYTIYATAVKRDTKSFLASPSPLKQAIDLVYERTGKNFMIKDDRDQFWYLHNTDETFRDDFKVCMSRFGSFELRHGTLAICEYGCGMEFLLVVTGDEQGTIWVDDIPGADGILPLGVDYLTWYENWLDRSLDRVEIPPSERKIWGYFEYGDTFRSG